MNFLKVNAFGLLFYGAIWSGDNNKFISFENVLWFFSQPMNWQKF